MMFKISSRVICVKAADDGRLPDLLHEPRKVSQITYGHKLAWHVYFLAMLLLWLLAGCQTGSTHIPPANFLEPGWTLHRGQAVWHLPKDGRDIAGEVLIAIRPEGRAFVQFTKEPFPILIGQLTSDRWEIEFPPQNKRVSRPGTPPTRIIWLQLPAVLAGKSPPRNWYWRKDGSNWRLENCSTGETLEGYFEQ